MSVDKPRWDARASLRGPARFCTSLLGSARASLRGAGVLADVEQHVAQGETYGARRLQHAGVIAIGKEPAGTPELPIDGASDADRKPLDPARKCPPILRLRDQVQVISLHREVHEAEAKPLFPGGQRAAHLREEQILAQRRHAPLDTQRE
jgi:hypothetical protein